MISGTPSVYFYTAGWCSVCTRLAPLVDRVGAQFPDVELRHTDIDETDAPAVPVKGVPTIVAVSPTGELLGQITGPVSESEVSMIFEAAAASRRFAVTMDKATRTIRLAAGVVLLVLGMMSVVPLVSAIGAGSIAWGSHDVLSKVWRNDRT